MILTIVHRLASNPMMNLLTGASNTTLAQAEVVEFQDDDSDINSRALLDMISEEAMVQVDQPLPSARAETVAGNHKVTIDEAFDNW